MRIFFVLIKKEILEIVRQKKFLIIIFLFLFAAIGSPIFAKLIPDLLESLSTPGMTISIQEPTYRDSVDQFVKNISQIVLWVLIFVSAGAIADEKSKKSLELLLAKPVSRRNFILVKFLSYFIMIVFAYFVSSLIFYTYSISIFESFSLINFIWIAIILLVYILLVVSTTICASAFSRSNLVASGFGFLGLIIYSTVVSLIKSISKYSPSYIIGHYKELLETGWQNNFTPSVLASLVLIVFLITIAVVIFSHQEIEN